MTADALTRRRRESGHPYQQMDTQDCGQRGGEIAADERSHDDRLPVPIDEPEIAVSSNGGAESRGPCRMQVQTFVGHAVFCFRSMRTPRVLAGRQGNRRGYSAAIPENLCSLATRSSIHR